MKEVLREINNINGRAFKLPALEYENLAEMTKHAPEADIVKRLNGYMHAHGSNGELRGLLTEVVQDLTKVPFLQKGTGEKVDGKEVTERDMTLDSDDKYVKRALALRPEVTFDAVEAETARRARGYKTKDAEGKEVIVEPVSVDLRKREAGPKAPAKLAQKYKDQALLFLTGKQNLDKFAAAFGKKFNGEKIELKAGVAKDSPENVELVGWTCKRWYDKIAEEAAAKATKEFAN
jgi:hypothetical protein